MFLLHKPKNQKGRQKSYTQLLDAWLDMTTKHWNEIPKWNQTANAPIQKIYSNWMYCYISKKKDLVWQTQACIPYLMSIKHIN